MASDGRRGRQKGSSIARVRRWLLAGLIVLVAGLGAVIGVARWKARKFLHDLPAKLGADIKSQANGYTYSQSVKGRTLFTVHAAKAIQRQDGKTTLHDVSITLYGPVGSNRADTIRGAEFEYDQPNGVARATGEVFMDLASPAADLLSANGQTRPQGKRIQATTSGLIFLQKLGVAATDQPIHLQYGDLKGGATGADFETDSGILRLRSNVQMDGVQDGQQVHLKAASAELDRKSRVATLHAANVNAGGTRAAGDTVVLDAGTSGGIDVIHATGNAWIQSADGVKAAAPRIVAKLSDQNKPTLMTMSGGVTFSNGLVAVTPGRMSNAESFDGGSQDAVLHFSAAGEPTLAEFAGAVHLRQASVRSHGDLSADRLVANLAQDASRRTFLKDAIATGSAVLHSVANGTPARSTTVRGNTLHAVLGRTGKKQFLASLTGDGTTRLDDDDGKGNVRSSTGDTLTVTMLPPSAGPSGAQTVSSAIQKGHVVVTSRSVAAKGKPASAMRATATQADFAGSSGNLTLTGSPVVTGNGVQLSADRVVLAQNSGNANASGSIRGVYVPVEKPGGDPVHVTADRAEVENSGDTARFFGGAKAARMWTPTAQVEAPVIELERVSGRMTAHAPGAAPANGTVHLLLPLAGARGRTGTARVTGSSLLYTPAEAGKQAHVDVRGGVRMESAGSVLTARQAIATLAGAGGKTANVMSGSVQQVVATGDVRLHQPGRDAQGERLLYTAADETYVLTGSPRVTDSQKGTVTGNTLVLHGADNSVDVTGAAQQRVHTEADAAAPKR